MIKAGSHWINPNDVVHVVSYVEDGVPRAEVTLARGTWVHEFTLAGVAVDELLGGLEENERRRQAKPLPRKWDPVFGMEVR